jgi:hypothetical protein
VKAISLLGCKSTICTTDGSSTPAAPGRIMPFVVRCQQQNMSPTLPD